MLNTIPRKIRNLFARIINSLWSLFLNGLFTILPITLTIAIFNVSFKLIISWLEPVRRLAPGFLIWIPFAEVILIILLIFLVGMILKIFILRTLIDLIESLLFKLPLIRPLYSGIKQLVMAFSPQDKVTFKQVVLIEFPRLGIYSLGFLTSELTRELAPNQEEKFFNVFVPTTPNPTSGYFVILSERNMSVVDLTRQEAMAMIISGGIIQPERFALK